MSDERLISFGDQSNLCKEINKAAKQRFKLNWTHCVYLEAGYAILHNCKKIFSIHGQNVEYDQFLNNFLTKLVKIRSNIFIIDKGNNELRSSPEYFDEETLRGRFVELVIFNINLYDYFTKETFYNVPIYVANEKWEELFDENLLQFRNMMKGIRERAQKFGVKEGATPLQLLGLEKPPQHLLLRDK